MRAGGEKRGNAADRAARRRRLMAEYSACVYCGDQGPWEVDRLVTGGSYRRENVVRACYACNRARNGGKTAYARRIEPKVAELMREKVARFGRIPA